MTMKGENKADTAEPESAAREGRSLVGAMARGARGRCPCCGQKCLFSRYLATAGGCSGCALDFCHHRADDLPAYLNIFFVGHIVVGTMMFLMTWEWFGMWTFASLTIAVAFASAVALMRPIKGAVIGAQWALAMHGFGGHDN